MSERLQTTVDHFKGGVLSMGKGAARHSIESWKAELEASDSKPLHAIATDLGRLHAELSKETFDNGKVAKLLSKLGQATNDVASLAEDKSPLVLSLGKQLLKAADTIDKS